MFSWNKKEHKTVVWEKDLKRGYNPSNKIQTPLGKMLSHMIYDCENDDRITSIRLYWLHKLRNGGLNTTLTYYTAKGKKRTITFRGIKSHERRRKHL